MKWGGSRVSAQPKCPPPKTPLIIDYCVKASYKNPNVLRQKYVEERLSIEAISKQFLSSKSTIYKYLRLAGIELRREDKKNRSQLRYGEAWKDGRVTKHEREQENITKMRELRAKGYSYWKIAEIFNSMGIRTKTRKGRWHARYVQKLIGQDQKT